MGQFRPARGEVVRVDLTSPLRALTFPVLELILITGLCWMAIGWLDRPEQLVDIRLRNSVVWVWAALATWRFVLPLLRSRRRRFMLTDRRLIVRAEGFRAPVDSIPLRDIRTIQRRRNAISLSIQGLPRPLYFSGIPRAKKVTSLIESSLPPTQARYW
ncbi:hypothetical protein [Corynebacterium alimapuense]|uniref:DUF304 domain-containing protein n=1 Tax=Corynebacterium alimapuense TaxID=1576874 RepID=A0A3M8K8I8_9CORY|nr:hypothetical protein [Corynebacterium alimapuense]RNE48778.1 hypothetical protein C5L39_05575 [Corynebacterium alimapuense]